MIEGRKTSVTAAMPYGIIVDIDIIKSAPASGSKHLISLISHVLDKLYEKPQLHGIQLGVATCLMSKVQQHRFERVIKVFTSTGFFDYVKTLGMKKADFERAIEEAPKIKPDRCTYIHITEYREAAKRLLYTDEILQELLL